MLLTALKECPNCSYELRPNEHYCASCGQSTHIHRFNLPHVFHEIFHALTHADKGVLHLIKELAIRPGVVAREYVLEGKRKKYFNPFTFLVLTVGLVVLSNSVFHPYTHNVATTYSEAAQPELTREQQLQGRIERRQNLMRFIEKRGNILIFLAVPILAFVYWLFFRRTGINFAEHLVAHVFFMGFYALVNALILVPLFQYLPNKPYYSMMPLLLQFFYLTFAYISFLPGTTSFKLLKTATATLLALIGWFIVSAGAGGLYIGLG